MKLDRKTPVKSWSHVRSSTASTLTRVNNGLCYPMTSSAAGPGEYSSELLLNQQRMSVAFQRQMQLYSLDLNASPKSKPVASEGCWFLAIPSCIKVLMIIGDLRK